MLQTIWDIVLIGGFFLGIGVIILGIISTM